MAQQPCWIYVGETQKGETSIIMFYDWPVTTGNCDAVG